MKQSEFIHLHVHSDFSISDGVSTIEVILNLAVKHGMHSIALTDKNNLFGIIKFYHESIKRGIKPILGVDIHVCNKYINNQSTILTLLATSNLGFNNLKKIISSAYNNYCNNIPVVKYSTLIKYKNDIIVLCGQESDIAKLIFLKKLNELTQLILFYKTHFRNNFYIEICRTEKNNFEYDLIKLSKKFLINLVATNNVKFASIDDFRSYLIKYSICNNINYLDAKTQNLKKKNCYLKNNDEMNSLFYNLKQCLFNSYLIALRCNVNLEQKQYFLPKYTNSFISEKQQIIHFASLGLNKRFYLDKKKKKKIYLSRLIDELLIINKMNFSSYFLIVMEFVLWSKENNIYVGPGRGSAASSLVAYALNITEIDPIRFNLVFERFLNPYRVSMPDIDIDFCMEKRDLVVKHIYEKYGLDYVANIITFGKLTAKSAIRDVGRILNFSFNFTLNITRMIPKESDISINDALRVNRKLFNLYSYNSDVKNLINSAKQLEGTIRTIGVHAGGIVIAPNKLINFAPIYKDINHNVILTQFDKDDIEKIGLVKFDFLALRTLSVIDSTIKYIKKYVDINFNIHNIPFDDKNSFNLLKSASTTAVFQLESNGIKNLILKMKPNNFNEIIALVALFRPGPLQSGMVDNFIKRKLGYEKVSFPDAKWNHDILKPILNETYGIIIYQEQITQIVKIFAGYSLCEADMLRVIISKKQRKAMFFHKKMFQHRSVKNGFDRFLVTKIFYILEKFSEYGFNKSHSTAYALITYQTLFLKSNFPSEFMCSVLNSEINNSDKLIELIEDCKKNNIKILKPNINTDKYFFDLNKEKNINFGLGAIKGIGKVAIDYIVSQRDQNHNKIFSNFIDFCIAVASHLNKNVLEQLLFSGAYDIFSLDRELIYSKLFDFIKSTNKYLYNKRLGKLDFFEDNLFNIIDNRNYSNGDFLLIPIKNLDDEIRSIGCVFSNEIIFYYKNEINLITKCNIVNMNKFFNKKIKLIVVIQEIKFLITKKKKKLVILKLKDISYSINIFIFNMNIIQQCKFFNIGMIVLIKGFYFNKFNKTNLICSEIKDFLSLLILNTNFIQLNIKLKYNYHIIVNKVMNIIKYHCRGNIPIYINFISYNKCIYLKLSKLLFVNITNSLIIDLKFVLGINNVIFLSNKKI